MWLIKIILKIFLSRIKLPYSLFRRVGVFKHGAMLDYEYANNVFKKHFNVNYQYGLKKAKHIMELGPGDSLYTGVFCWERGLNSSLVDVGAFAEVDSIKYSINQENAVGEKFSGQDTKEEIFLNSLNCEYFSNGLYSIRKFKDKSIDFCFSQAVLEHVPVLDFEPLVQELYRILKPGAICSNRVDLKDHLGGGLNNLRWPQKVWETKFLSSSGFYTNRLRFSQIIKIFESVGFECTVVVINKWSVLPLEKLRMAQEFHSFDLDDLMVSGFDFFAKKNVNDRFNEN